jgi:hypothetical protein
LSIRDDTLDYIPLVGAVVRPVYLDKLYDYLDIAVDLCLSASLILIGVLGVTKFFKSLYYLYSCFLVSSNCSSLYWIKVFLITLIILSLT